MKRILRLGDCYALAKHKLKQYKTRYISLLAVLTIMCLYAVKQVSAQVAEPAATAVTDTTTSVRDTLALEEVQVNTGYQRIPKERATGSFIFIDSTLLHRSVSPDMISRLKSAAPTLMFDERTGGAPQLSIRGRSTIFAEDQPLIVLDNFPYDGDISNINPNDIASVTILKDAAAASIWGVRAGNGVIVITTKSGHLNRRIGIGLQANLTIGNKPDAFYQPRISTKDFIDVEQFLFEKGFYSADLNNGFDYPPISPVVDLLYQASEQATDNGREVVETLERLGKNDIRNDIEQYLYQRSLNEQYILNIEGGNEKHQFYYAMGVDRNRGDMVGNGSARYTLNIRETFEPLPKLKMNAGLAYTLNKTTVNNTLQDITTGGPSGRAVYPYQRLRDDEGNNLAIVHDYSQPFKSISQERGLLNWDYVPLDELKLTDNTAKSSNIRATASVSYPIVRGLKAAAYYLYERQTRNTRLHYDQQSYYARNLINQYSVLPANGQDDGAIQRNIPLGDILNLGSAVTTVQNGRFLLDYHASWQEHMLTAIAGFEAREVSADGHVSRFYGYDSYTGSSQSVDMTRSFPLYPGGSAFIPDGQGVSGRNDRFRSWFSNASYSYNQLYTISLSGRIDQSNYFGVNANQRSVPLWSVGLKYNLSREGFYRLAPISKLILRLTYGLSGNIDKTVAAFTTARYTSNSQTGQPSASLVNPPNPNLKWEKSAMLNVGLDFSLRGGILDGSIEFYKRKGTDLMGFAPLNPTTGFSSYKGNVAGMNGKGIDVQLNGSVGQGKFRWNPGLNFNYTADKVTRYSVSPSLVSYLVDASLRGTAPDAYSPTVGKPLFGVYSFQWGGLDPEGNPIGFIDGKPSTDYVSLLSTANKTVDSLVFHGRAQPSVYGAFLNSWSYGSWKLSVSIAYRLGYNFKSGSIDYNRLFNSGVGHGDFSRRWRVSGDENNTTVPSMPAGLEPERDRFYLNSAILVQRGDNIRLQDLHVSYTFNRQKLEALNIREAAAYLYINNMGLLWTKSGSQIDPDFPRMPLPLTFSLGFNIKI